MKSREVPVLVLVSSVSGENKLGDRQYSDNGGAAIVLSSRDGVVGEEVVV